MPDYRFELATHEPAELEKLSELFRLVFPHARHLTPRYLQWNYLDNPDGRAVACNAWLGDALVGHMSAQAMQARLAGRSERGLFFQNGAIHPDHRGRRLQSEISARMFEEAARDYSFAVGAGNKYSTGPLLTRFKMVRPMEARIGLGLPVRRADAPAASFERSWSEEALQWRLANPEARYGVRGGAVLAATGTPGFAAVLHDTSGLPDAGAAPPGPLRVWIGADPAIDWRRSRFLSIPKRLRRSPLNLVFRDLTGAGRLPDPDRFVWRAIDFDPW